MADDSPTGPDGQPTRPRFGTWTRSNGDVVPLVFHPDPDTPDHFIALQAADEAPVEFDAGDRLTADVIGAGQSITFEAKQGENT